MATAYPHDSSRDGDVYGADRLESSVTYVSLIDHVGDDPFAPVIAIVPEYTPHPDRVRYPELVAQRYVLHRTPSPVAWLVDVVFDFPDRLGFAGWRLRYTSGEETAKVYRDLDGQMIGSHSYDIADDDSATPFYADTVKGRVKLKRPEGDNRIREGTDVLRSASGFVLSRTLRNLTAAKIRAVEAYKHTANVTTFLGWLPGELMFREFELAEEDGPQDRFGRPGAALIYPTELHFAVKLPNDDEPEGWPIWRAVDFFSDDRGNEAIVFEDVPELDPDPAVETRYRRYWKTEFRTIFSILEGGAVAAPPAGIGTGKGGR